MYRILTLISDETKRHSVAEGLQAEYEVVEAPLSPSALDLPFDLWILDEAALNELEKWIRAARTRAFPALRPVLLLVSRASLLEMTVHLGPMVDDFLIAPFDPTELQVRVTHLLKRRRGSMGDPAWQTLRAPCVDLSVCEQVEESLRRTNALLVALDQATEAMLQARSTEDVISAIGERLHPLGIGVVAFALSEDQTHLKPTHFSMGLEVVQEAEDIGSISAADFRLPLTPTLRQVVFDQENLLHQPEDPVVESELASLRPICQVLGTVILTPLNIGDKPYGMLAFVGKPLQPTHIPVLSTFAHQASLVLKNIRLLEESRHQSERMRALAQYLQGAQEAERARVAREIHDEFAQFLTAIRMEIDWLRRHLSPSGDEIRSRLEEMDTFVRQAIQQVRRIAHQLRPSLLDHLGLLAAIEWQAKEFSGYSGVACSLHLPDEEPPLDRTQTTALFRILQEALTNVARHSGATRVDIAVGCTPDTVRLRVSDNGVGISEEALERSMSLGLLGMRERAEALGGTLAVYPRPEGGTTVEVELPL